MFKCTNVRGGGDEPHKRNIVISLCPLTEFEIGTEIKSQNGYCFRAPHDQKQFQEIKNRKKVQKEVQKESFLIKLNLRGIASRRSSKNLEFSPSLVLYSCTYSTYSYSCISLADLIDIELLAYQIN